MGLAAGPHAIMGVLSIALALAASPEGAGAAEREPASAHASVAIRLAALAPSSASAERSEPFGWARPAASLADTERWRVMRREIAADRAALADCRLDPSRCRPAAQRFLATIEAGGSKEGRARLGAVNRAVNLAIVYTSDLLQHGAPDVWSAPLATFASGRGDCEDYAIAKYLALVELGVAARDLRLVIVETRLGGHHAMLGVRFEERWLILDNARFTLAEDGELSAYRAVAVLGPEPNPAPAELAEAGLLTAPAGTAELRQKGAL